MDLGTKLGAASAIGTPSSWEDLRGRISEAEALSMQEVVLDDEYSDSDD